MTRRSPFRIFPYTGRKQPGSLHTTCLWEWSRNTLFEYMAILHGLRYSGTSNIPRHGPMIFAPNHVSYYDPPLVNAGVPFRVRSMAWDALFHVPLLRRAILAYGGFPVKLKSADKSAIAECLRVLRNGECLLVFPEGERSGDGKLGPLEKGVARVALQTGATIIPVTITGAFEAWPRYRRLPRWFCPIRVRFHAPIEVPKTTGREETRRLAEEINERIARPIRHRLAAWERLKNRRQRTDR